MHRRLPDADWPGADRALWAALVAGGGPLDEVGALSHLRAASLRTIANAYGTWFGWLAAHAPEALAEAPADRATPERLAAWMAACAGMAPASRLTNLEHALRVAAAARPEADWRAQRRLLAFARREALNAPSPRKTGRIVSSVVLLEAGLALARGDGAPPVTREAAARRRDGTMVAFLALIPLRRRAFCALEIGRSLLVDQRRIAIALSADMTKTGTPWDCVVPQPLDAALRRYLAEARPLLVEGLHADHGFLWTNDAGRRLDDIDLGARMPKITERLVGVRVSVHLFRDAVATTLAHISPDAARLTTALLGHSGYATAERHYNHARGIDAGRVHARLIADLRETPE